MDKDLEEEEQAEMEDVEEEEKEEELYVGWEGGERKMEWAEEVEKRDERV